MKLKVGAKLGLGFGIVLLTFVVSGVLNYMRLSTIRENAEKITRLRIPTMEAARVAADRLDYAGNKVRQGILSGTDPVRRAAAQKAFDDGWDVVDQQIAKLDELAPRFTLQENRDRVAKLKEGLPKVRRAQQATIDDAANGGKDGVLRAGNEYTDKVTPVVDENTKVLDDLAQSFDKLIEENAAELAAANNGALWTMVVSTLVALVAGIVVSLFLSRKISTAAGSVLRQAEAIAKGDLTDEEMRVISEDELGDLTRAVNKMHVNLREIIQSISENAQNLGNASEEFSAVSQQISANSEETSAQASTVTTATEQVSRGLQTVATSTEEMSSTIKEIAKSATEAAKVAEGAMRTAAETNAIVAKLGESSAEIGQVIKVITSIAQKTDLLALNATVEAARAGEAGAGFAVVANEVKELAKQTANATEEISRKIEAIQGDAKSAVSAIATISGVIGQVNDISGTIATAVEQQSATTSEMSRNVSEAARGAGEVAQNIQGVAQAAESTSHGATDSQKAAKNLAEMSTHLRDLVNRFKVDGRRGKASARSRAKWSDSREMNEEAFEEELASK